MSKPADNAICFGRQTSCFHLMDPRCACDNQIKHPLVNLAQGQSRLGHE